MVSETKTRGVALLDSALNEPAIPQPRGRFRYWLAGICLLLIGLLITAVILTPAPEDVYIAEATMPDGTVLVLKAVTYGKEHKLPLPPRTNWFLPVFLQSREQDSLDHETWGDKLVVWLARYDPKTGRALDFEWWLKNTVVDANGDTITDRHPSWDYRFGQSGSGSSGSSGPGARPYDVAHREYDQLYASSELPLFRCNSKTFQLRVHNADNDIVATFDVPWPGPKSFPIWEPEPLPISKPAGDLTVTLKRLDTDFVYHNDEKSYFLDPSFRVTKDGKPASWHVEGQILTDALGNTSRINGLTLLWSEPAWKLTADFYRNNTAPPLAAETWNVGSIEISPNNEFQQLDLEKLLNDVPLKLLTSGGGGVVTYTGTGDYQGEGSSRWGMSVETDNGYQSVDIDTDNIGPNYTQKVRTNLPHLRLDHIKIPELKRLQLHATDNLGNRVDGHLETVDDHDFWFFMPVDEATEIDLKIVITQGRRVEFLVAPPSIDTE